jgi:hypothetical protein
VTGKDEENKDDFLKNFFGKEPAAKGKKNNVFGAWDDNEKLDIDFTTELILADNEQFDILAERGYETLYDYSEQKEKKKMQEYELQ